MATQIYDSNGNDVGRVEDNGTVYDSGWSGNRVGEVNEDKVSDNNYRCVGRFDSEGKIYDSQYGGSCVGRVERDGTIYDSDWGSNRIGRVEGPSKRAAAAAYLLLLRW